VILARPAAHAFEIYMTRRSARSGFAPDAFVFPGGTVDGQDRDEAVRARALGSRAEAAIETLRERTGAGKTGDEPAALLAAALRELFEEAGLLLARTASGAPIDAAWLQRPELHEERERLCAGTLTFAALLERHDWYGDAHALIPFSHWVTPPSEPRRYDTYFFLASAPADQAGKADAVETHDGIWIAPERALQRHREGDFHLVYPTIKHLERLACFDQLEPALEFARNKPIATVMPDDRDEGFGLAAELERSW
jgi:8-oxo-dGTP pyrophosphatase MutT (NUDIX family)